MNEDGRKPYPMNTDKENLERLKRFIEEKKKQDGITGKKSITDIFFEKNERKRWV